MKRFLAWLRKSWLACAALVISCISLYLTHGDAGKLKIFLPDEVGVSIRPRIGLVVVLPLSIVNTGAPIKYRVVEGIRARIDSRIGPSLGSGTLVRWRLDLTFVDRNQYLLRHPGMVIDSAKTSFDYIEYENRALPFLVQGGSSVSRVLGLEQEEGRAPDSLQSFVLNLHLRTYDKEYDAAATYDCGNRFATSDRTIWCSLNMNTVKTR